MRTMIRTGTAVAACTALLGAAASAGAAEYATVVSATPVSGSVAAPRRDCVQGEQIVQQPPSGAGALVGAIAGGVIGNQFGHGFGKAAATGLGAVAGSAIGNNVEASANPATAVPVQRCRTVNALRKPHRRLRRRLRIPRPALHDPPAERPGPAPGDRHPPGRWRAARSRRAAGELRCRATGLRRCADVLRAGAELRRRRAGVLRPGRAGLSRWLLRGGARLLRRALLRAEPRSARRSAWASATGSAAPGIAAATATATAATTAAGTGTDRHRT